MATLQMVYNDTEVYNLWCWESQQIVHQTAKMTNRTLSPTGHIRVALLGPLGEEPMLTVITKMARPSEMRALEKESRIYTTRLKHLQGTVVPICYGLYRGKMGSEEVGFLLLEYCQGPQNVPLMDRNDLIMIAVCKLHQAGVLHGSLDDLHHIVCSDIGVRIIDFSGALENHRCVGGVPMGTHPSAVIPSRNGCSELVLMEKIYGLMDLLSSHNRF
ncbi:hypothetical protein BDP27DRAFT_1466159 [Rhodocollybia butyracea]|uniref:Protein kinase domain-containing protein n=1 Tax=Rhodocollybia butyracea TaxID=206335 RepID=A0A9P5PYT1_9AGAR|nr:hypothetical protein BDP27DRAFT_1466159 [Rhodocollybia butyracea]